MHYMVLAFLADACHAVRCMISTHVVGGSLVPILVCQQLESEGRCLCIFVLWQTAEVKVWVKFSSAKTEPKRRKLWENKCRPSEGWQGVVLRGGLLMPHCLFESAYNCA